MDAGNRKLIRPSLSEPKEQSSRRSNTNGHNHAPKTSAKKTTPPDHTNAENFYYVKQMQTRTPMVVVLRDGETIEGYIEWYDRNCLKINRDDAPNLLIYKDAIKYLYKAHEALEDRAR